MTGSAQRKLAVELHHLGKFGKAAEIYAILLEADPDNTDILGLLSIADLALGKTSEALNNLRKSQSLEKTIPGKFRNLVNFLLAMQKLDEVGTLRSEHRARCLDFLDRFEIPDWPSEIALDKDKQSIVLALVRCLIRLNRKQAGLQLLDSALIQLSVDPDFVLAAVPLMLEADSAEKAADLLQPLTSGSPENMSSLLIAHAAAATAAGRKEEAEALSLRAREAVPIFLSRKMPDQRMLVGVLSLAPSIISRPVTPMALHFSANISAALVSVMNDEFRFVSMFPRAQSAKKAMAELPQPQLIINNWVNAETLCTPDLLDFISGYADSFGVPVINHPRKASLTTRQLNAERLAGIPGVRVPRIIRFVNEAQTREAALLAIERAIGFPVIIRNPFGQKGWETVKIDTAAELATRLASSPYPQLYAIEYIHNALAEGVFRKIRAVVIGDELFMHHVHLGAQWNVHRASDRKNIVAFDIEGAPAVFEQKVLSRPEEALGKSAMTALHEIRKRMPLDVYGIDFDLMPDGSILYFEANASMRISLREREGISETRMAMRQAYRKLMENPPRTTMMPTHPT